MLVLVRAARYTRSIRPFVIVRTGGERDVGGAGGKRGVRIV